MIGMFHTVGRSLLFSLDPERGHGLAISALKSGLVRLPHIERDKRLETKVAGLTFPHPIGMAAGFDKNAEVANALLKLGFGFAEVGTVTPRPQAGNPKPRIFRLVGDDAIINRLGFNNEGHQAVLARLKKRNRRRGLVGVNIGANKDSDDRVADYTAGIKTFATVADYFAVNVSSPNTPGLRDLQAREHLSTLLKAVITARDASANINGKRVPIFLKIAPDLDEDGLDDIAAEATSQALDGLIISNTSLSREGLRYTARVGETGGLSGRPLFDRSTVMLAKMRLKVGAAMPLIGVGGVNSAKTALDKIMAGADLVQLYTGFIYQGPALARDIVHDLRETLDRDGTDTITAYRDREVEAWAAKPLIA